MEQKKDMATNFTTDINEVQKVIDAFGMKWLSNIGGLTQSTKEFSWDAFKNRQIAVNCKGYGILKFLSKCDKEGIKFPYGSDKTLVEWYKNRIAHQYDNEVCFLFNNGEYGGLNHSEKCFFIGEGFTIVEFDEMARNLEDYSDKELINELLRRHSK